MILSKWQYSLLYITSLSLSPLLLHLSLPLGIPLYSNRLGMYRDAEGQFQSALRTSKLRGPHQKSGTPNFYQSVDMYLYLCKVYMKLDQPLKAVEYYHKVGNNSKSLSHVSHLMYKLFFHLQGLERFPNDSSLLVGIARIQEVCPYHVLLPYSPTPPHFFPSL